MRNGTRSVCGAVITTLAALVVTGCGGSSGIPVAGPTPGVTATSSAPESPTATPTPTPTGPDIPSNHRDFGYIHRIDHVSGVTYLEFDRAYFLTGDAANAAAAAAGQPTPVPNDYYIVNDNPRLRTYRVASTVVLIESQVLIGTSYTGHDRPGPFSDLESFVADHPTQGHAVGFHLHFDTQGRVDRIHEQFVP